MMPHDSNDKASDHSSSWDDSASEQRQIIKDKVEIKGANRQANHPLNLSGRIARYFESAQLTPLLALLGFLLGVFALIVTPREEEPQVDVTMANVIVPYPGATATEVERKVAVPAEKILSQITGVEHVMSASQAGLAVMTVQFKVGIKRNEAVVRLYDTVNRNTDWLPPNLGVYPPIIKPKGIDDVPIVSFTLFDKSQNSDPLHLKEVATTISSELQRIEGTREISIIGGNNKSVLVNVKPDRLNQSGITISQIAQVLQSANMNIPAGDLLTPNQNVMVRAGNIFEDASEVADIVVGQSDGTPIYLKDVAEVKAGAPESKSYVWYGENGAKNRTDNDSSASSPDPVSYPAVTIAITKKPGSNAIAVSRQLIKRVNELKNSLIPNDMQVVVTRDYGETANDKVTKLVKKLIFATISVVALVFFTLGKRESLIVGIAVTITLALTLFASWAYGYTLNRVSLFALIFSIGILVDDAIVVVENIHRHKLLFPQKKLFEIIPYAVDEVGGPTILATLTVIAALLPMAFVSGLMGPYMAPIPINASMGMLLSLIVAIVITPWLANKLLKHDHHGLETESASKVTKIVQNTVARIFRPFLSPKNGSHNRKLLGLGITGLIILAVLMPAFGLVILKMLPFDNKSELQIVVDMPDGTPLQKTAEVVQKIGDFLPTVPVVKNYQAYVGSASPINFNGLVRQYYFRQGPYQADIQVNLVDQHHRHVQSHEIATKLRPYVQDIGAAMGANVKVVEVPPGPPVLSPLVTEVYGPSAAGRDAMTRAIRQVYYKTKNVVDVDDSLAIINSEINLKVDRQKAALRGVSVQQISQTLQAALNGLPVTYLHDDHTTPSPILIQLDPTLMGSLNNFLKIPVQGQSGELIEIGQLVTPVNLLQQQLIYHKDLLPMQFVTGDAAGTNDSPLYAMADMVKPLNKVTTPDNQPLEQYFIKQPSDTYKNYSVKWDGEWQITYETFRDMGMAYAVGLLLIYLLVVSLFGSYRTPLIIMAPIPLTVIGVMPGHALLHAQFTATSMIGMIALAGIIVRNSILLVDYINIKVIAGEKFEDAVVQAAVTRAQPIILTALAAMIGSLFIIDDPIFNGLAISLIFGILVSTLLTLLVIPLLYYVTYRNHLDRLFPNPAN